jgi:uroporphyrinogen III methyltransferase/synthase
MARAAAAEEALAAEPEPSPAVGQVFLVGAGPGDPGLLTLRGRELLEQADVVVYDRLVEPALLSACRPNCELLFVGKSPGEPEHTQPEINRILVARAAHGLCVVRLKGGDPFVFGRGGEEAAALAATGIPFEIVPGVTSAVAVPAYAGIPLTHRDVASSFAVVTGHERPGRAEPAVDWAQYGRQPDTLVVLMGREAVAEIAAALVAAGRPATTPAAVISGGTTVRQRTAVADLQGIAEAAAGLPGPAVLVVGAVVRLREQLEWWERRPLHGRRVLLTRTRQQSSELAGLLRLLGAEPVELPVIRVMPETDSDELAESVRGLAAYWWLCFTSANAVDPFFGALERTGQDARALAGTRVAAVGPATARALAQHGIRADVVPPGATAFDLVESLRPETYEGQRALFVRGEPASDALALGLQGLGLEVHDVVAYRTVPDDGAAAAAEELLRGPLDAVTFASSATVGHFLNATGEAGRALCSQCPVVCIGPVTARAAEALGVPVAAVARQPGAGGMIAALVDLWAREGR